MNTLEATYIENPLGVTEECAKFTIDDTTKQFLLSNIAAVGREYTLSFWIMADTVGTVHAANRSFSVSTQWEKQAVTFNATQKSVMIWFKTVGTYYIYHPQLEEGNKPTDWAPATEDMATGKDLQNTKDDIVSIYESISYIDVKADGINANVSSIQKDTKTALESANNSIDTLRKEVDAKMTAEAVELQIKTAMENGTSKVVTETGFIFDSEGLTIEKSGSEMKTQITEDGMTVYQNEEAVLEANNQGVNAKNLHATTYLIVGGRSRFENYGDNRTGCFWIGG